MLLDYKNKFATKKIVPVAPDGTHIKINDNGFRKWSNVNMYRTSYNDMSNTVSQSNRFIMHHSILFCIKMVHVLIV